MNLPIEMYYALLLDKGIPDREASRAALYAEKYGYDAMQQTPTGHTEFDVPTCKNLDCINPEHQQFVIS